MTTGESSFAHGVSLHTFIISWPGFESKAEEIEKSVSQVTGEVHVIHSHGSSGDFEVPPHWMILPNEAFYGAKFLKSLELCSGSVMLQIQADAFCDDWPEIIYRCRSAFAENQNLGLWAPLVDWTPWSLARTSLEKPRKGFPQKVSMIDGIVWALGPQTLERVRELDFSTNSLGRGIDLAAASFVMAQGLDAVVDPRIRVTHPRGSGYSEVDANYQLQVFLTQLNDSEQLARAAIEELQAVRLRREKQSPSYLAKKFLRRIMDRAHKALGSFSRNVGKIME